MTGFQKEIERLLKMGISPKHINFTKGMLSKPYPGGGELSFPEHDIEGALSMEKK